MATPSGTIATLRPELGTSFEEFSLEANKANFIAGKVMPVLPVDRQSNSFGKISVETLLKDVQVSRAPGTSYHESMTEFTYDTYATKEYGHVEPIDDREAAMYKEYLQAEQVAARRIEHILLRKQEERVAALIFNASTWTGASLTTGVSTEWDTSATCTPIADVLGAVNKVHENSGLVANTLIIGMKVFLNLLSAAEIIDRIKYSGFDDPKVSGFLRNRSALAAVMGLEQVLVGGGMKNTAIQGQTATPTPIWDDEYAMVCHVNSSPDFRMPCVGRTFQWDGDGATASGVTFESYRDEDRRSNMVRGRHEMHEKVILVEAGHLLSNITT